MSEINVSKQKEKIIKMKLQTAKVLWGENRKEATFLVLESIDDSRADDLRERMGFDEDFEVDYTGHSPVPIKIIGIGALILVVLSFLLGTFLDLSGAGDISANQVITEDDIVDTIITPTPESGEPITQPLVEMTGTASQVQQTQSAIEDVQDSSMSLLDATETARYEQGTATEDARSTETAGG